MTPQPKPHSGTLSLAFLSHSKLICDLLQGLLNRHLIRNQFETFLSFCECHMYSELQTSDSDFHKQSFGVSVTCSVQYPFDEHAQPMQV